MRRLLHPALLLLALAACSSDRAADAPLGGSVVVGTPADPDHLLPPLITTVQGRTVTELLFDRLAEVGPSLNVVGDADFQPRLARSWEWSADSLAITFALDPRARWHDGTPVRAGDALLAFAIIRDPRNASPLSASTASIDSVVAPDSLTVRMHFARRYAEQFYHATLVVPVPAHRLAAIPAGDSLRQSQEALRPVGSGRFRLVAWTPKDRLELAAVEDHYRGRPKLDRVLWVFATTPAAGLTRVWSGETDVWEPLPPTSVADAAAYPHVRVIRGDGFDYQFFTFNLREPGRPERPHPIFGDRATRRALTMAIDRDAARRAVFDTLALRSYGPFVRAQATADTTVAQIPFDRDAAAALLDSLGWRPGADGIRVRGGRRLAFAISVPTSSQMRIQTATVMQEQWKRVGVEADVRAMDFQAMIADLGQGRFDGTIAGWRVTPSPSGIRGTWGSAAIAGGWRQNFGRYENPEFDRAVVEGLDAVDMATRKSALRRAFQIVTDDAAAIWLYETPGYAAVHRRLVIPAWRADAWWMTLGEWSVDPAQRLPRDARPAGAP